MLTIIFILCRICTQWERIMFATYVWVLSHFSSIRSLQPHGLWPARLLCPWDSTGKNTGVGCHALLQGVFWTQGLNPCLFRLQHRQADSLPLSHLGNPLGPDSSSLWAAILCIVRPLAAVLQPLHTRRSLPPQTHWDNQKHLQSLSHVPRGFRIEDRSRGLIWVACA